MNKIEAINSYYTPEAKEIRSYYNPEFIKNLAIKMLDSKQFILFKPALRCGKTSFYTNLLNEIKNKIELRELKHPLKGLNNE